MIIWSKFNDGSAEFWGANRFQSQETGLKGTQNQGMSKVNAVAAARNVLSAFLTLFSVAFGANGLAQSSKDALWQIVSPATLSSAGNQPQIQPLAFKSFSLDYSVLQPLTKSAPMESTLPAALSKTLISLPMPDGTTALFRFVESPVMQPVLAAQYPEIKTYLAQGVDNPLALARFDVTPAGFHAQILSPDGAVYVDPYYAGNTNIYASYFKRDYQRAVDDFQCFTAENGALPAFAPSYQQAVVSGGTLRTYRLACAATGEYTTFFGGTVALGLSAIVTAINRVTGIYETEVAIRLMLVANNDQIVYTNANTDPYTNGNAALLLSQNQSNLDFVIGSPNYDIGHVFGTAGGGLAGIGVVCNNANKAYGETGLSVPIGDAFYVDYVAHEMGHQFGAHHTFNSSMNSCGGGNRTAMTAYEPGSGSTIMSYAGICGTDNLQSHSDPYFHSASIEEIVNFMTGAGNSCSSNAVTGNNPPSVSAGSNYTIPGGTPFTLTASGTDPDHETLTYCWEERDLGPSIPLGAPDDGSSPLFRSFPPTLTPSRTFPQISDVLNNTVTPGECLPATNHTLQFRVTARDNHAGGGGVNNADMTVTVVTNGGPLVVTTPSNSVVWTGQQTITWNPGGSANPPINAANVNILLSTNGGVSFPITLAANVPNDGVETVMLPSITSSNARIRVEAVGNIFFSVCRSNFTITPPAPLLALNSTTLLVENCGVTNGLIDPGETVTVNFSLKNIGLANTTNLTATLLATNGVTSPSGPQNYGALAAGGGVASRPFTFTAAGTCGGSIIANLRLQDGAANLGTIGVTFNMGSLLVATQSFSNATFIAIRDTNSAVPYPSTISISGITGTVTKVTATLTGLSHTFPDDIDVLLVGPGGQKVMLMSDVGGGNSVTNITITLDDSAASSLPDSTLISSGTYKPTNIDTNTDNFPAPAPGPPYLTNLSVFNSQNPNGTWSLYVQDDGPNDTGSIAGGWSLSFSTSNTVCCTGAFVSADLALGETLLPAMINVGGNLTCTLAVTNLGPGTASGVIVTDALPAGLSFVSAVATQGACTNNGGVVTCSVGAMTNAAIAFITITATGVSAGLLTNSAAVTSSTAEFATTNNTASATAFVNSFPTISSIPNQVVNEDTSTQPLAFVVGDAETPAGSLLVSASSSNTNLVALTNIALSGIGSNRTVTVTPLAYHFGGVTITIAVSDGLAVSSTSFLLSVTQSNHPPILSPITNFTIVETTALVFTNSAADLDVPAQTLTFSLGTNVPAGAFINPTNGIFSWTPSEAQGPSTNVISVVVTDDGTPNLSASQSFTVVVLETNSPPVLAPIADQTITEGFLLTVTNSATDPDIPANILTFSLGTNAPAGAAINPTNGLFTWTPSEAQGPSTNLITVIVTDDGTPVMSATQSFTVVVLETNSAPVLAPIADQTINEGTLLTVTNHATDSDIPANILTFSLGTNAPISAAIDPTNGLFTWTPLDGQAPSTNLITVIVTDNGSPPLSAMQTFTVVVVRTNLYRPMLTIPDQVVVEGELLTVTNLEGFLDLGATVTFSLDTNDPAGTALNPTNGVFTWTPTEAQGPSTNLIITYVVFSNQAIGIVTQTFNVIVLESNSPPVLAPIVDRMIHAGTTLVVTNAATDPDLPANVLTFSLDPGAPSGATIKSTNGLLVWNTADSDANTTNIITVRVTDNGSPSLSDTKSFTVIVLPRPTIASINLSNNVVMLTWSAISGQVYRAQFKDSLDAGNWTDLAPDVTATDVFASQTNSVGGNAYRFYRVRVLP
jgi:uncharacterized repeat protein (TIGR01451 family)